ncbi:MAG: LCP family protein [Tissierellia bacterium]|nr:LCP family protein [Tissierellia bacterium]
MIRHFLKIFFLSMIFFIVTLSVSSLGYILLVDKNIVIGTVKDAEEKQNENEVVSTFDYNTDFGRKIKDSNRINVLVVGTENSRTDTIIVASYDTKTKIADLISVPRDTYYPREGYDRPDSKKINAIYSGEGIEGLTEAVQDILGIPINKYVIFDYEAVVKTVDIMEGVEVNVPFHMVYNDPYDDPPLVIDIPEGKQLLDGEQSLKFLRYRKGYDNQDLGRIKAQQEFIKSAAKKVLSLKLPAVIEEAFSHVETNFSLGELLGLAGNSIGFSIENINSNLMPGVETPLEGLSFFIPNDNEIMNLVYTIYGLNENAQ